MDFKYYMPTKVLVGENIVEKSKEDFKSFGKKALIVTGRTSSKKNGSLEEVIKALSSSSISYVVFDEIEENPSIETVVKGGELGKKERVDFIIGIGGGSPIDASKAIGVMIKNTEITEDTLFQSKVLESIDIIAVPTTSGTGTETTQYSILTDHKNKTKKNLGQVIFPKLSLLDPRYTMDTPLDITINTAVDAFTHIVEGYLNKNATLITDGLAEKALSIWGECIEELKSGDISLETREKLMISSTMAGMVIAQTGTSIPHGMGYALTYNKNIPHGLANGVLYVEYLRVFENREKVNKIYKLLSLSTYVEMEELLKAFTKTDLQLTENEIEEYTNSMISNKAKLQNHPEEVGFDEIYNIYKRSLS